MELGAAAEIRARSRGRIARVDYLDFHTMLPLAGGLFCPAVFGPPEGWDPDGWGHIDLPAPVLHPAWLHGRPSPAAVALGMSQRELLRQVRLDPGPLCQALAGIKAEVLAAELRPGRGRGPRSHMARRAVLDALARREGPPVVECLPVVPALWRPYHAQGDRFIVHHVNDLYRRVINRSLRLERLMPLEPPPPILQRERAMLQYSVDALLMNRALPRPLRNAEGQASYSLADIPQWAEG